jgi:signal peptidase I
VLVFQPPENKQGDYIKRIIAVPGDAVEVKNNAVYVNGRRLDEDYIMSQPSYILAEQKIPINYYFVLGDNRNNSNDSHNGWVVPRENMVGKAWLSIWPPEKWGIIPDYNSSGQTAAASSE